MENKLIKGIDKMFWLLPADIEKLEHAARLHRRYANIGFKVISVTKETIIVRVFQGRHLSENYTDRKRLAEIGHETFDEFLQGRKLHVGPVEFQYKDFLMIGITEDLGRTIDQYFKTRRDFLDYLSIFGFNLDETTLSNHIAGRKELTEWHRMGYSFALSFYKFNKGSEKLDMISIIEKIQEVSDLLPIIDTIKNSQKDLQASIDNIKKVTLIPEEIQKSLQPSFDNFRKATEEFKVVADKLNFKFVGLPSFSKSEIKEAFSTDKI